MAITNLDELVAGFNSQQMKTPTKFGAATSAVIGYWNSSWRMAGSNLGSVPATGAGAVCDGSTAGRLLFDDATGANTLYLSRFHYSPSIPAGIYLYDRLVHTSGLSGTTATSQTINTVTLPTRGGTGDDVELWLEVYTTIGATSRTATFTYTNQAGTGSRTAVITIPVSLRATSMIRVPLQSGDTGVRSVQSVLLSGSTGTAGDFGVTLCKRIASIPGTAINTILGQSAMSLNLPEVPNDNCLFFITTSSSTTSPSYDCEVVLIEG